MKIVGVVILIPILSRNIIWCRTSDCDCGNSLNPYEMQMARNQKDIRVVLYRGSQCQKRTSSCISCFILNMGRYLVQSSSVAYQYGISGLFYAAGASIQIVLFAILAIEMKRKAPSSPTFPEIIYHRFKKKAHLIFLLFGLMTNTIVTAMLILGGAAVVSSLLMPVGVILSSVA